MMSLPSEVKKYFLKNELKNWNLETDNFSNINSAIVIPAICELGNIKFLLKSLSENDNKFFNTSIVIFVVNNLKSSSDFVKNNNQESLNYLRKIIQKVKTNLRIGFVDASSEGKELPEKEGGVGFARKIGMDLALKYFDYSSSSKKILVCLDADCTVEKNYITSINEEFNSKNFSAAVVSYKHNLNEKRTATAIICYEIFLRYYVLGLKFANSPFAFPTIGSTMACDYESYIKIGGMNKRKAAEDFYFLEKLAKTFNIHKINSTTVYPSSRESWRVPFGTGQRVNRFLSNEQNEYLLYNPKSFLILKRWLKVFMNENILLSKIYLQKAHDIHKDLYNFLLKNNFEETWNKIFINSKTSKQIKKQKINWFDGFRTLKLIHYLRDNNFPQINMFDALDEMLDYFNMSLNIKREKGTIPKIEIQKLYLETLRNL